MTQDEIVELAGRAGLMPTVLIPWSFEIHKFAKLVAAKEREACAKVCIEHGKVWGERMLLGFQATLDDAAEAIRARGEA